MPLAVYQIRCEYSSLPNLKILPHYYDLSDLCCDNFLLVAAQFPYELNEKQTTYSTVATGLIFCLHKDCTVCFRTTTQTLQ